MSPLDSVWHEDLGQLLLLTASKVYTYARESKRAQLVAEIQPTNNKLFKCFALLNDRRSLLIAYDEWEPTAIERWEPNKNDHCWTRTGNYPIQLTMNEFIGSMLVMPDTRQPHLAITIYNHFTEQWRMELRELETMACLRTILLPETDIQRDYRIIHSDNRTSLMDWLVYSPTNNKIIAIDRHWTKTSYVGKLPVPSTAAALMRKSTRALIHTTP